MALPPLTPEQRSAALEKAAAARILPTAEAVAMAAARAAGSSGPPLTPLDLRAAATRLAFAQPQHLRQAQLQRHAMQAVFSHQVGSHARQVAFVGTGKAVEQQARDRQAEHGISQKFETLVVVGTETSVRQGSDQQRGVAKPVASRGVAP